MNKLRRLLLPSVLWVACAVFNYGAMNADLEWERVNMFTHLHDTPRDHLGIAIVESCIIPPIQVVSCMILTNFMQHGWYLGDYR